MAQRTPTQNTISTENQGRLRFGLATGTRENLLRQDLPFCWLAPGPRRQNGRPRWQVRGEENRGRIQIKMGPFWRHEVFHSCTAKTRGVRPVLSWTFTLMSSTKSTSNTAHKKQRENTAQKKITSTKKRHYYEKTNWEASGR